MKYATKLLKEVKNNNTILSNYNAIELVWKEYNERRNEVEEKLFPKEDNANLVQVVLTYSRNWENKRRSQSSEFP